MTQSISADKQSEPKFKHELVTTKTRVKEWVPNDHGMIDYLADLWHQIGAPFKSRIAFLQALCTMATVAVERQMYPATKVRNLVYVKLQDETERLGRYKQDTEEVLSLMKRREEVSEYDPKYKEKLGRQVQMMVEEYRKQMRKNKHQTKRTLPIEDIFWKGIAVYDWVKADKELREIAEKQTIKSQIQDRKAKLQAKATVGLPPPASVKRAVLISAKKTSGQLSARGTGGLSSYRSASKLSERQAVVSEKYRSYS